jgi:hypothetical protein
MGWKNWGDHPVVVAVSLVAGLAGLISLGYTIASVPSSQKESAPVAENKTAPIPPSPKQSTQGDNSPVISNSGGNVNLNIDNSTKVETQAKSEVPKFEGKIQDLNLEDNTLLEEYEGSKKFLNFITENDQKVIYLDIWPYYAGGKVNLDKPNKIVIPYPHGSSGATIYEIIGAENSDFFYNPTFGSRKIKGYFKVVAVYPYMGGSQRIRLKPVAIENVRN